MEIGEGKNGEPILLSYTWKAKGSDRADEEIRRSPINEHSFLIESDVVLGVCFLQCQIVR